jgi:hypothetical protein
MKTLLLAYVRDSKFMLGARERGRKPEQYTEELLLTRKFCGSRTAFRSKAAEKLDPRALDFGWRSASALR